MAWHTRRVAAAYDLLAPDGSEIRRLARVAGGSLVHCTLQPGQVTRAVRHRTVEELWYCVAGRGQVWRSVVRSSPSEPDAVRQADEIVDLEPGVALTIPLGVGFQMRSTGAEALEVVIATMPPWPGADEAAPVDGVWDIRP